MRSKSTIVQRAAAFCLCVVGAVPAAAGPLSFCLAPRTPVVATGHSFYAGTPAPSVEAAAPRRLNLFVDPPRARVGRAWIEFGGFLAASIARYWIDYKSGVFSEDWQFNGHLDTQFKRIFLFQGWRFDSNNFKLNWTHSLAGGVYYQFARTNYMTWLQSWLMACAGSMIWETAEWKEVVSLNDQIMTGIGGFATGEPWYQFGEYLSHQRSIVLRALGFVNPLVKLNHWFDRRDPAAKTYRQPAWHDLGVFVGARRLDRPGEAAETGLYFGAHSRLMTLPDYGRPGDFKDTVKDVYFSEFSLDYAVRNGHADETNFTSSAVTWGYFRQKIGPDLEGYSLTVGLGSSFQYFKKRPVDYFDAAQLPVTPADLGAGLELDRPRNFTDKLAIVHVAGPVLDWTLFRRGLRLRTVASAYLDFGLINSLALNAYSELHHTEPGDTILGMKTTVLYYGYYYGFGTSWTGQTKLEWGGFRAQALASFSAWGSADFRDRFPQDITNNAHLSDTRLRYLLGVGWKVPRAPVELFVAYEGVRRTGRLPGVRVHNLENRTFAGLEFTF